MSKRWYCHNDTATLDTPCFKPHTSALTQQCSVFGYLVQEERSTIGTCIGGMFCCTCKWISVIYTVTSRSPLCFTFSFCRWWNGIVDLVIQWIIFPRTHTSTYPWNQDGLFVSHIMQDKVWCLFVITTQKAQTVIEAQLYTFLTSALHGG